MPAFDPGSVRAIRCWRRAGVFSTLRRMLEALPHMMAAFNLGATCLLIAGLVAIRRGDRHLHPRLMLGAVTLAGLFLACYVTQVALVGHGHFPGDDWVRTLFLTILASHTSLAIVVLPLVIWTLSLALRGKLSSHRRLARITLPIWLYVLVTGLVIYWMGNHLRPSP